jgi:hypothetical protein
MKEGYEEVSTVVDTHCRNERFTALNLLCFAEDPFSEAEESQQPQLHWSEAL